MKPGYERKPRGPETEEQKALENVLQVLENLFFSMPIPEDIMEKYNYLKENKLKRVGLDFVPITKAQYPAIGTPSKPDTALADVGKLAEVEECFTTFYADHLVLLEATFNNLIERCNGAQELAKDPYKLAYRMCTRCRCP